MSAESRAIPVARARRAGHVGAVHLIALTLAACAPEDPAGPPAAVSAEVGPVPDGVSRAVARAALLVRSGLVLGEGPEVLAAPLAALADAELRDLEARAVASLGAPAASAEEVLRPARRLRAALAKAPSIPQRQRGGGVPQAAYRLLEHTVYTGIVAAAPVDRALQEASALLATPDADITAAQGALAGLHADLVALQRTQLRGLATVLRFLDDAARADVAAGAVVAGWLGLEGEAA